MSDLFSSLSVSASGMSAQKARAEVLVENLANAETTRTPQGGPYRRKDVVFSSDPGVSSFFANFESSMNSDLTGVKASGISVETTGFPAARYS